MLSMSKEVVGREERRIEEVEEGQDEEEGRRSMTSYPSIADSSDFHYSLCITSIALMYSNVWGFLVSRPMGM